MRATAAASCLTAALAALAIASCRAQHAPPPPPPPKVSVAPVVEREIMEWDEYTARLEAIESVDVRARVSGYLESIHFKDGAMVKAGDLLFVIDPRPYRARLLQAEAEQAVASARLDLAKRKHERAANLVARDAISQEEADIRAAEAREAEAAVAAAAAAVEAAKLDVEFTSIHAPIGGRVGRRLVTEGNLVSGGAGVQGALLTTIVTLDPIYAYFEADERSFLKYSRLARSGERPSSREFRNPVRVALADERGFPHEGHMDFVDNQLDRGTGTMVARAVLPNPGFFLAPGLFARLQIPGSGKYRALLIPESAVLFDQATNFVWVVDEQNEVRYRSVQLGRLHEGRRIVREGLEPGERIIVEGIQRARPGLAVSPEEAPPAPDAPAAAPATTTPPGSESAPPPPADPPENDSRQPDPQEPDWSRSDPSPPAPQAPDR